MRGWASSSSRRWEFRLESVRTAVSVAVETRAAVAAAGCIGAPSLPPNPRPSSIRSPDTSRPGWPPAANPPVPPAASSHRLHPLAPSPQRLLRSTPMTWHDTTGRDRTGQDRTRLHPARPSTATDRPTDRPRPCRGMQASQPKSRSSARQGRQAKHQAGQSRRAAPRASSLVPSTAALSCPCINDAGAKALRPTFIIYS